MPRIQIPASQNWKPAECIITLENECNALEQYGRRNNLKISGFLDSDPHDALEIKVIKYLNQ